MAAVVVARLLGVAEFGGFALLQGCLAMFVTFAAFGIGQTMSQHVAALKNIDPGRIPALSSLALLSSTVSGGIAVIALWVVAPMIASVILNAPELSAPLRLAAPALFFSSVAGALNGTVAGFEALDRLAKQGWVVGLATFGAVVAGASLEGLSGAAVGLVIGEAARMALAARGASSVLMSRDLPLFSGTGLGEARVLWTFSLPTVVSGALHLPVFWSCQAIIAGSPNGMVQIGHYDAAQKWMTLVIFVPTAASAIVGPVLASLSVDYASHRATTLRVAAMQTAACAIPAVLVALFAPVAMGVFGSQFTAGASTLIVMMALAPITMAIRLAWSSLLSLERAWTSCMLWLLWAALAFGLTYSWQEGGAYGLAWAMLVAYATTLCAYGAVLTKVWRS
jgi:O-antigen/teichoic acid export membrane protein